MAAPGQQPWASSVRQALELECGGPLPFDDDRLRQLVEVASSAQGENLLEHITNACRGWPLDVQFALAMRLTEFSRTMPGKGRAGSGPAASNTCSPEHASQGVGTEAPGREALAASSRSGSSSSSAGAGATGAVARGGLAPRLLQGRLNGANKAESAQEYADLGTRLRMQREVLYTPAPEHYELDERIRSEQVRHARRGGGVKPAAGDFAEDLRVISRLKSIFLVTVSGEEYHINANARDSVGKVKYLIQEQYGIPAGMQRIWHDGWELSDKLLLRDVQVHNGSVLRLKIEGESSRPRRSERGYGYQQRRNRGQEALPWEDLVEFSLPGRTAGMAPATGSRAERLRSVATVEQGSLGTGRGPGCGGASAPRACGAPRDSGDAARRLGAAAAGRTDMIFRIFSLCDTDNDGWLGKDELQPFAALVGFEGDGAAWAAAYGRLVAGVGGNVVRGLTLATFARLLDDKSSAGIYCTSKELHAVIPRLELLAQRSSDRTPTVGGLTSSTDCSSAPAELHARSQLLDTLVDACDADADGKLNWKEMDQLVSLLVIAGGCSDTLHTAYETELTRQGGNDEWVRSYARLCEERGCELSQGIPCTVLSDLVDDQSEEFGCYCTNEELQEMFQLLEENAAAAAQPQAAAGGAVGGSGPELLRAEALAFVPLAQPAEGATADGPRRDAGRAAARPSVRSTLIAAAFQLCDVRGTGVLGEGEMRHFAELAMWFGGDDRDWAQEYANLCCSSGAEAGRGLSRAMLERLIDDESEETGCYCTDRQLRFILKKLEAAAAAAAPLHPPLRHRQASDGCRWTNERDHAMHEFWQGAAQLGWLAAREPQGQAASSMAAPALATGDAADALESAAPQAAPDEGPSAARVANASPEQPACRENLIHLLFEALSADGAGRLGKHQLRVFAELTGFEGSHEEWDAAYASLCFEYNLPRDGFIDLETFTQMINDPSVESGCYCTDLELFNLTTAVLDSLDADCARAARSGGAGDGAASGTARRDEVPAAARGANSEAFCSVPLQALTRGERQQKGWYLGEGVSQKASRQEAEMGYFLKGKGPVSPEGGRSTASKSWKHCKEHMPFLQKSFLLCDKDGDGRLNQQELFSFAVALGFDAKEKAWSRVYASLCHKYGISPSLGVDWDLFEKMNRDKTAFSKMMGKLLQDAERQGSADDEQPEPASERRAKLVATVFQALDADGDGELDVLEMRRFAGLLGFRGGEEEWREAFSGLRSAWGLGAVQGVSLGLFYRLLEGAPEESILSCTDEELRRVFQEVGGGRCEVRTAEEDAVTHVQAPLTPLSMPPQAPTPPPPLDLLPPAPELLLVGGAAPEETPEEAPPEEAEATTNSGLRAQNDASAKCLDDFEKDFTASDEEIEATLVPAVNGVDALPKIKPASEEEVASLQDVSVSELGNMGDEAKKILLLLERQLQKKLHTQASASGSSAAGNSSTTAEAKAEAEAEAEVEASRPTRPPNISAIIAGSTSDNTLSEDEPDVDLGEGWLRTIHSLLAFVGLNSDGNGKICDALLRRFQEGGGSPDGDAEWRRRFQEGGGSPDGDAEWRRKVLENAGWDEKFLSMVGRMLLEWLENSESPMLGCNFSEELGALFLAAWEKSKAEGAGGPGAEETEPQAEPEVWHREVQHGDGAGPPRQGLISALFSVLDQDADRRLSKAETRSFAVLTGFQGSDEEWSVAFASLAEETGSEDAGGIDLEIFTKLVNDESEEGCWCSDEQLRLLARELAAGGCGGSTPPLKPQSGQEEELMLGATAPRGVPPHGPEPQALRQAPPADLYLGYAREELLRLLFDALDTGGSGTLGPMDMRWLACETGFEGSDEGWAVCWDVLMEEHCARTAVGVDFAAFSHFVNDESSETGCFCSDAELRELLRRRDEAAEAATGGGAASAGQRRAAAEQELARRGLVAAVFRELDGDRDGRLGKAELRRFAELTGFQGGEEAWHWAFELLCKEVGCDVDRGLEEASLLRLVNDTSSHTGCYCTDDALRELLRQLRGWRAGRLEAKPVVSVASEGC